MITEWYTNQYKPCQQDDPLHHIGIDHRLQSPHRCVGDGDHPHEDQRRVHLQPFKGGGSQLGAGKQLRAGEADVADSRDNTCQQRHAGTVKKFKQLGEGIKLEP